MAAPKKILIVLTSHDKLGSLDKPTGWFLPELAHPYDVFVKNGYQLTFASPAGGKAPLDPVSIEMFKEDASSQSFLANQSALTDNTDKLSAYVGRAGEFDALFVPGGHGPMFDLATDETSRRVIAEFAAAGKVVAAVCHGPAAFVNVTLPDGSHLLQGKEVTGFSNAEEDTMKLSEYMPFMLETKLDEASGGKFVKADEQWGEKVVVAGKVITGQNPASAHKVGEEIAKALGA